MHVSLLWNFYLFEKSHTIILIWSSIFIHIHWQSNNTTKYLHQTIIIYKEDIRCKLKVLNYILTHQTTTMNSFISCCPGIFLHPFHLLKSSLLAHVKDESSSHPAIVLYFRWIHARKPKPASPQSTFTISLTFVLGELTMSLTFGALHVGSQKRVVSFDHLHWRAPRKRPRWAWRK